MDFGIHIITTIGDMNITQTMMNSCLIAIALIVFAIVVRVKLKKFTDVPTTGLQNVVELLIETMDSFTVQNMGKKYRYFSSWFFTLFAFVLISNYAGLLSFRSPTADLATTFTIALITFTLIHFMGIKENGIKSYVKGYFEPYWFLFPINIIGELATPLSLSMRLFGNILGGTIIMGLVNYSLSNMGVIIEMIGYGVVTPILHMYFDIFAGFLQTFVFVILSMTFIKEKIGE